VKLPPLSGLVFITLLWTLFYAVQNSQAAEQPKSDMRVLIDISGSMKQSDPQNLRIPAVKLLLNLAPDNSRFGIWSFGQMVNNLVPSAAASAQWKSSVVSKVNLINSAGLYTNIGLALEKASMGQTKPDPEWERTLVLLSDGKVDISKDPQRNAAEKQRILEKVVPRLQQAGFHIHSVALSDNADLGFLKELSIRTGGSFSRAGSADELLNVFVAAADRANVPDQVPLEGNHFAIDDSIEEFTALVFRKSGMAETKLVAPDGSQYSLKQGSHNVSWFADQEFDLITVYNPMPGDWEVVADIDPDNRVTVVSNLQVNMEGLPENVLEGENLVMKMTLSEKGRTITNPNFLKLMEITFRQDAAGGETFEGKLSESSDGEPKVPADGIYSAKLGRTITDGTHTFSIVLDGKTFKRKKSQVVMVHQQVLEVTPAYRDNQGDLLQYLNLQTVTGLVNPEDIQIVAQITDPQGEKSIQNAVELGDGKYTLDVPATDSKGAYEVLVRVSGTSLNGHPFELVQGPYTVDYTPIEITNSDAGDRLAAGETGTIETFDEGALEIPTLEVEELPPEGGADELYEPPEGEELQDVSEPDSIAENTDSSDASPTGFDPTWILVVLGNLVVIGGGIFIYMKFLRKTDEEQSKVVQEIEAVQQQKKQKQSKAEAENSEQDAAPVPKSETKVNADAESAVKPDVVAKDVVNPVPEPPLPEQSYQNETSALELEDDETVEVGDDSDGVPDEQYPDVDMTDDEFQLDDPKKD